MTAAPRARKTDQQIKLRAWTGFASQDGARLSIDTGKGTVPGAPQTAAIEYLRAHDAAIASAALGRVLKEYPRLRRENNANVDYDEDDEVVAFERSIGIGGPRRLPAILTRSGLRDVMSLSTVHVLGVARNGFAYVGFQFSCDWDDEHEAGILMHRRRVVAFGHADVAFTAWRATDDGGASPRKVSAPSKPRRRALPRARGARG